LSPAPHRGAPLPYILIAGVEPVRKGWLVVTGRLMGSTLVLAEAVVFDKFIDVLDARPSFQVITLHAPVGLPESDEQGGRECDRAARRMLGFPRQAAIVTPPSRKTLLEATGGQTGPAAAKSSARAIKQWAAEHKGMSATRVSHVLEVDDAVAAYWQRTVYECNPELSFLELNSGQPLKYGKHSPSGIAERRALLEARLGGADRFLDREVPGVRRYQLWDACADLWTARRIAGRAINSLPESPQWDELGRRMELVR
jgi:predicted RNase H-like nuclease